MKTTEDKDRLIGWCSSVGVHVILLLLVAATGLFQAVSSESRPVDVEIYENMTDEDDSSAEEAAADDAASEPAETPAVDPIVVNPDVPAPAVEQDQKEKPDEKSRTRRSMRINPPAMPRLRARIPMGMRRASRTAMAAAASRAPHRMTRAKPSTSRCVRRSSAARRRRIRKACVPATSRAA